MAIDSAIFELFQKGEDFDQIRFLDNFYENLAIDQEPEQDLIKLLKTAIDNTCNIYVKREAFKILCELTLTQKITNHFYTLGILQNLLSSDENILQVIALKYLPYFPETRTDDIQKKIIEFSDAPDGDVSSQAYFCLGLFQLTDCISQMHSADCIINLEKAKLNFRAAVHATENRVDAEFFIVFIEWSEALASNNMQLSKDKFRVLKKNLQIRTLYEIGSTGLELDFLVFQLTEKIQASFNIVSKAKRWLEIQPQIQALLNFNLEIQMIKNIKSTNQFLTQRIYSNVFKSLESIIYRANLSAEKERLYELRSMTNDYQLEKFIIELIAELSNGENPQKENNEFLALLAENQGSEDGLKLYNQISNKNVSPEVLNLLSDLLRKNKNNRLPFRTGSIYGQEVLTSIMLQIDQLLPHYPSDKRTTFFNIIEEVIRYTRNTFVGYDKKHFSFLFAESEGGMGQKAIEQDLQDSMLMFFGHSQIADGLEHEQAKFVDGGRVDIIYKKDLITIPIELKKSLLRPDQDTLERSYIAQAQTYTAGYNQLGIFVLLELSEKSNEPPPNFKDWFYFHHLSPSTNMPVKYPDYIVSVIIPGNRTIPSKKSTYR